MLSSWGKRQRKQHKQLQKVKQKKIQDAQRCKDEDRAGLRAPHYTDVENKEIGKVDSLVNRKSKETQLNNQEQDMYEKMMPDHTSLKVPPIRLHRESGKRVIANLEQSTAPMHQVDDHTSSKITRTTAKSKHSSYIPYFETQPISLGESASPRQEHNFMETNHQEQPSDSFAIPNRSFLRTGAREMQHKQGLDTSTLQEKHNKIVDTMEGRVESEKQSRQIEERTHHEDWDLDFNSIFEPFPNVTILTENATGKGNAAMDYTRGDKSVITHCREQNREDSEYRPIVMEEQRNFEDTGLDLDSMYLPQQDETFELYDINTGLTRMETNTSNFEMVNMLGNETTGGKPKEWDDTSQQPVQGTMNLDLEAIRDIIEKDIERQNTEHHQKDNVASTNFNTLEDCSTAMDDNQPKIVDFLKQPDNQLVDAGTDSTTTNEDIAVISENKLEQMNTDEDIFHLDLDGINLLIEEDLERRNAELNEKRDTVAVVDSSYKPLIEDTQPHEIVWSNQMDIQSGNAIFSEYITGNESMAFTSEATIEHVGFQNSSFQLGLQAVGDPIYNDIEQNIDIGSENNNMVVIRDGPANNIFSNTLDYSKTMEENQSQLNHHSINVAREYAIGNGNNVLLIPEHNLEHNEYQIIEYDGTSILQAMGSDVAAILGFSEGTNERTVEGEEAPFKSMDSESHNHVKVYTNLNQQDLMTMPDAREITGKTMYSHSQHFNPVLDPIPAFPQEEMNESDEENKLYEEEMVHKEPSQLRFDERELDPIQVFPQEEMNESDEENKLYEEEMEGKEPNQFEFDVRVIKEFHEELVTTGVPEGIIKELVTFHKDISAHTYMKRFQKQSKCLARDKYRTQYSKIKKSHERRLDKLFAGQYKIEKPDKIVQRYKEYNEAVKRINEEYDEKVRILEEDAQAEHYQKIDAIKEQLKTINKNAQHNPMQADNAELVDHLKEQICNLDIIEGQRRTQAVTGNKDFKYAKHLSLNREKHRHRSKLSVLWKEHYRIDKAEHTFKRFLQPGLILSKRHVSSKEERKNIKMPGQQKDTEEVAEVGTPLDKKKKTMKMQENQGKNDQLLNRTSTIEITRKETEPQIGRIQRKRQPVPGSNQVKGQQNNHGKRRRFEGSCSTAVRELAKDSQADEQRISQKENSDEVEKRKLKFEQYLDTLIHEFKQDLVKAMVPQPIVQELVDFQEKINIEKCRLQTIRYQEHEAQNAYVEKRFRLQQVVNKANMMPQGPIQFEAITKAEQEERDVDLKEIDWRMKAQVRLSEANADYHRNITNIRRQHTIALNKLLTKKIRIDKPVAILKQNEKYAKFLKEEKLKLKEAQDEIQKQDCEAQQMHNTNIDSLKFQLGIAKENIHQHPVHTMMANKLTEDIQDLGTKERYRQSQSKKSMTDITKAHRRYMEDARHNNILQSITIWKQYYGIEEFCAKFESVPLCRDIEFTDRSGYGTAMKDPVKGIAEFETGKDGCKETDTTLNHAQITVTRDGNYVQKDVQSAFTDVRQMKNLKLSLWGYMNSNVEPDRSTCSQWEASDSAINVTSNESNERQGKRRLGDSTKINEQHMKQKKRNRKKKQLNTDQVDGEDSGCHGGQQEKMTHNKSINNQKKHTIEGGTETGHRRVVDDEAISKLARDIVTTQGKTRKKKLSAMTQKMTAKAAHQQCKKMVDRKKQANQQSLEDQTKPTHSWKSDKNKHGHEDQRKAAGKNKAFQERQHKSQRKEAEIKQQKGRSNAKNKNKKDSKDTGTRKEEPNREDERKPKKQSKPDERQPSELHNNWRKVTKEYETKYCDTKQA